MLYVGWEYVKMEKCVIDARLWDVFILVTHNIDQYYYDATVDRYCDVIMTLHLCVCWVFDFALIVRDRGLYFMRCLGTRDLGLSQWEKTLRL